jgi:hypothetical protein
MATDQFIPLPGTDTKVFARFMAKVTVGDGCWTWTAARNSQGYGMFGFRGINANRAHRVAWMMFRGEIPAGIHVLHTCDNPSCVKPSHLFLGTPADNSADMVRKGRHQTGAAWNPRGELNPKSKCTEVGIREIRALSLAGIGAVEIGRRFHISRFAVWSIVTRRSWPHVS